MKLYLSSYRFGDNPERLGKMARAGATFGYILNAVDQYGENPKREAAFSEAKKVFEKLGIGLEQLDLRNYFGKPEELAERMKSYGGVWVIGGNAFVLRRAMRQSGFDSWLDSKKNDDDFVYAGYSAGICVLAKSMRGLENMDEPKVVPEGYEPEAVWEGLGVLDYLIVPHYDSPGHPETEAAGRTAELMAKNRLPFKSLRDGQVLVR